MTNKEKAARYDRGIESLKAMMESSESDAIECANKFGKDSVLVQEYQARAHAYKCAILALTDWQD